MTKNDRHENARMLIEDGPCTSITVVNMPTLCDYFEVTPQTITRRVANGELPLGIKRGREKVWRLIDIRKAIEKEMKKTRGLA